jgi:dienelactone hydrolase
MRSTTASFSATALLVVLVMLSACSHSSAGGGAHNSSARSAPSSPTSKRHKPRGVATKTVSYESNGLKLEGYLAYPKDDDEKRPGVLVVHEWWGLNDYVRSRAEKLAEEGYVALAVDMYGEGKSTEHPDQANKFMIAALKNIEHAQQRFLAAQELLAKDRRVDAKKLAAIGYCFGGATVLHMARSGDDKLKLVASFHGNLATQKPMKKGVFDGKIFVAHGAADPFVPHEQVDAFKQEMDGAKVDYEVVEYEGAKHAFTNPDATALGEKHKLPLVYNAEADAKSWAHLLELLDAL